jgi:hypothetical protein
MSRIGTDPFGRVLIVLEELQGKENQEDFQTLGRLRRIMPRQRREVNHLLLLVRQAKVHRTLMADLGSAGPNIYGQMTSSK